MRFFVRFFVVTPALALGLAGCGPEGIEAPEGSLLREPLQELPDSFVEVGLYPAAPDLDAVPERAVAYEPAWPLWSNGSAKRRYIVLPEGTTIDTASEPWVFPTGTLLFKTFSYGDGDGDENDLRPVETRVMRLGADDRWDYGAYRWSEDGKTAHLVDPQAPDPVTVESAQGQQTHTIPAKLECRSCHESRPGEVLGFEALQLGDPAGEGAAQLDRLSARGLFSQPPQPAAIDHADPATRAILGLFYGDCVHCHNGGDGPSSSFDLRPGVALENTIGTMTASSASAFGIRIVAGDPSASVLFQSYSGETSDPEVKLMPPVGVDVRDDASIERLRAWIIGLGDDA